MFIKIQWYWRLVEIIGFPSFQRLVKINQAALLTEGEVPLAFEEWIREIWCLGKNTDPCCIWSVLVKEFLDWGRADLHWKVISISHWEENISRYPIAWNFCFLENLLTPNILNNQRGVILIIHILVSVLIRLEGLAITLTGTRSSAYENECLRVENGTGGWLEEIAIRCGGPRTVYPEEIISSDL